MAPIVQPEAASSPVWEFINKHKVALTAAGVLAAGTAGYLIYNAQQASSSSAEKPLSPNAKKNKKKKNKKKQANKEKGGNGKSDEEIDYPKSADGLPNITEDFVKTLSEEDKDKISFTLKEAGNVAFKAKDFEKAIGYYTGSLNVKPDPVFYSNRSACFASLEKFDKVIEDTTAALKLKPDYGKCLLRRATAYEKLENYSEAMFDLASLTILGGFDNRNIESVLERNLRLHSERLVSEDIKNKSSALPSVSSIASFFGAFREEPAIEGLQDVEKGTADDFLVQALEKLKESTYQSYELADSYFNQAITGYGDVSKDDANAKKLAIALEYSGALKFLKNSSADALVDLDRALTLSPRPRIYIFKALISADKGNFEEAIKYFDTAIAEDANNSDSYYHKGQMYYLINDLSQASENFVKAKELNPENVYAYIQLACIAYREGRTDEAEKKFAEAKKQFPTSAEIPNYHGEILSDKQEFTEAIKEFDVSYRLQQAAGVTTIGVVPLVNKATILSRQGEDGFKQAAEILEQACNEDPRSELARVTLAQVRLQQEKPEDAIKLFEEASKLARTAEEKIQATSYAEATKMQFRIKQDPYLSVKVKEMVAKYGLGA